MKVSQERPRKFWCQVYWVVVQREGNEGGVKIECEKLPMNAVERETQIRTNLLSRLLEGFLFEADSCLGCLIQIDTRLNQTEGGDPETMKKSKRVSDLNKEKETHI